ncbi:serpin family protein [Streptomyces tremellae]|uniref:Serpin domain-containing protein n=1 Tax=Streptomyces tremellae TaxID=1124239 RepID=A0ABP7FNX9_9ACTN
MAREQKAAVAGVAALTARWARGLDAARDTVFSAAGAWPLLALLAETAEGPARGELESAVGAPAPDAAAAARELLAELPCAAGLNAALGLWTARSLPLRDAWLATLPRGSHAALTGDAAADRAALDAWAARQTGGLIDRMPVDVGPGVPMVLASALRLATRWEHPFTGGQARPSAAGPWAGQALPLLTRTTPGLGDAGVADTRHGPLTLLPVRGDNGIDVHLLVGPRGAGPGEVIGGAMDSLTGRCAVTPADALPYGPEAGPGLAKDVIESTRPAPGPVLRLDVPAFRLTAHHDLLRHAEVFGLASASDASRGHFPGISPAPLAVGSAAQAARAEFGAEGFEAAAVTAFGMRAGAASAARTRVPRVIATLDRPFGFAAVQRATGLCLATGWVAKAPSGTGRVED